MSRSRSILAALIVGAAIGAVARLPWAGGLATALDRLEPIGAVFIKLVTMVVVPLVVSSLFVAVASLDSVRRLGRLGGATLAYFLTTTLMAAIVGVGVAMALGVGRGGDPTFLGRGAVTGAPAGQLPSPPGLVATLVGLVPDNVIAAATRGDDLLPLLVAVCIFGAAATLVEADRRRTLLEFFRAVDQLSAIVLRWIMGLAAPAVLILIAAAVSRSGTALLANLAWFAFAVVVALAVHVGVVLVPALVTVGRQRLRAFASQVSEAVLLAFSTASSSAALPVSLAAADRLGLPAEASSLVLPAGVTIDKNGAAVYKAVTAVCVAHWAGLTLDASLVSRIVVVSTLAAFTGAGVPGSSLVTTVMVLQAIGLGAQASAAIALVAGIDRPLDMCRTAVNTFGNLVGVAVVTNLSAARK
jgi:proton glutamate symport protein